MTKRTTTAKEIEMDPEEVEQIEGQELVQFGAVGKVGTHPTSTPPPLVEVAKMATVASISRRTATYPRGRPLAVGIRAAVAMTGLGRTTIYRLLSEKKLIARKNGRSTLILVADLENLINSLPEAVYGDGDA